MWDVWCGVVCVCVVSRATIEAISVKDMFLIIIL